MFHRNSLLYFGLFGLIACGDKEEDTQPPADTDTDQQVTDADSDNVPAAEDCDDNDANLGATAADADCDGVLTAEDCDDSDETLGASSADTDCDGVLTADDCDDTDKESTTVATDADCDGVKTAEDCDDDDDTSTTVATDADCDEVLTAEDCDDSDATISTKPATDSDCDGVIDADDAFPNDASETDDTDGDGLGDNQETTLGTNPNSADSDNDGVSDSEEVNNQTDPNDPDDGGLPEIEPALGIWTLDNGLSITNDSCGIETKMNTLGLNIYDYLPTEFELIQGNNGIEVKVDTQTAYCGNLYNTLDCDSITINERLELEIIANTLAQVDLVFGFDMAGTLSDSKTMTVNFETTAKDCFDTDSNNDGVFDTAGTTCSAGMAYLGVTLPCTLDLTADATTP